LLIGTILLHGPPTADLQITPNTQRSGQTLTRASILFAEGRNAVQVQRWLGHHSAAFTLATYVHLLDGDLGEPLAIPQTVRNDAK
jgi:hypothetical protein